jgi:hypothetical protein
MMRPFLWVDNEIAYRRGLVRAPSRSRRHGAGAVSRWLHREDRRSARSGGAARQLTLISGYGLERPTLEAGRSVSERPRDDVA